MTMPRLDEIADLALQVWETKTLPAEYPTDLRLLSLDDAYAIQSKVIDRRIAQGERVAGYKVGCTSDAIRRQFGLCEPICGRLMVPHVHDGETVLRWQDFVHCAIEPEFVLCIRDDVTHDVVDERELCDAIEWVAPGIEVHHYKFWFGAPTSQELIISNGIHAALVVGELRQAPTTVAFDTQRVEVFRNRERMASGTGAEIMGGPLKSLHWLVRHLRKRGEYLRAGQLVIPGSPVELISVGANDRITAAFSQLQEISAHFIDD